MRDTPRSVDAGFPRTLAAALADPVSRRQAVWIALVALLSTPCLFVLDGGEYLWTDQVEIAERGLVMSTPADLAHSAIHGISGHYYRPAVFGLHTLNGWIGGGPLAYRATNTVIHGLNAVLLFLLLSPLGGRSLALATVALFVIHPLAVTPIRWVSDRSDLLCLFGILASCLSVRAFVQARQGLALVGVALSLLLALSSKETAAAAVLLTAAGALSVPRPQRRGLLLAGSVQAAVGAAWFAWRGRVTTNPVVVNGDQDLLGRLATSAQIHLEYLGELALPSRLTVCDASVSGDSLLSVAIAIALLVCLALVAVRRWRAHDPLPALGMAWTLAFLLPTVGFLPLKHVRADRYLYCALPGILLLCCSLCVRLTGQWSRYRWLSSACFCCVYVFFSASTLVRSRRFRTNVELWSYEVDRRPNCFEGWANLGREAYLKGDLRRATAFLERVPLGKKSQVIAFRPQDAVLYYTGLIQISTRNNAAGRRALEQLLRTTTNTRYRIEASYSLGLMAVLDGNFHSAVELLTDCERLGAAGIARSDLLLLRAYVLMKLGRIDAARADFEARRLTPSDGTKTRMRMRIESELRAGLLSE